MKILSFLTTDKKRINQYFNFTFLKKIGSSIINQQATETQILKLLQAIRMKDHSKNHVSSKIKNIPF